MSVEELVKLYRTSPLIRDKAVADKLEELAAKAGEWEERFWKRDAQADRLMQERAKAEAALAEAKRENEALREDHDEFMRRMFGHHGDRVRAARGKAEELLTAAEQAEPAPVAEPVHPTPSEARLREALEGLLNHYVELVLSGDAGFWDPEKERVVIEARSALNEASDERALGYRRGDTIRRARHCD